jgi:hypothetical protein
MQVIDNRSLPLSASPDANIRMTTIYTRNLQMVGSSLLAGITDPPRYMSDALKHNKLHDYLTKQRIAHETYWEECLKKVHWEVDSSEILDAFANDRPIEQVCTSFVFAIG